MRPIVSQFPLTNLLCQLLCYTDEQVRKASPDRAVKNLGVRLQDAQGYLAIEKQIRGLV